MFIPNKVTSVHFLKIANNAFHPLCKRKEGSTWRKHVAALLTNKNKPVKNTTDTSCHQSLPLRHESYCGRVPHQSTTATASSLFPVKSNTYGYMFDGTTSSLDGSFTSWPVAKPGTVSQGFGFEPETVTFCWETHAAVKSHSWLDFVTVCRVSSFNYLLLRPHSG